MSFFRDLGPLLDGVKALKTASVNGKKKGLIIAAEHVLSVSNQRVPHETGDLARSGGISQDDSGRTAISYDTDYAVVQHEDVSLRHDAGRQAKFLESSLISERELVRTIVANSMKREMGL
jgi:hypothetical protein